MADKLYRQEIKQLLTPVQSCLLEQRIASVLSQDSHSDTTGCYHIRSIYFDSLSDEAYEDKLAGVNHREKIRIRFYGLQPTTIKLERKEKNGNLIHKDSVLITKETAEEMLSGDFSALTSYQHPLTDYVYSMACSKGLRPVIVVDYVRKAYTYPVGNVRITFDTKLQARSPLENIWEYGSLSNVLGEDTILEIKFNRYLPEHIRQLLCSVPGQRMALSKYTLCRENLGRQQGNLLLGKT